MWEEGNPGKTCRDMHASSRTSETSCRKEREYRRGPNGMITGKQRAKNDFLVTEIYNALADHAGTISLDLLLTPIEPLYGPISHTVYVY